MRSLPPTSPLSRYASSTYPPWQLFETGFEAGLYISDVVIA